MDSSLLVVGKLLGFFLQKPLVFNEVGLAHDDYIAIATVPAAHDFKPDAAQDLDHAADAGAV